MEEVKSRLKGILPFLCITCTLFVYIEDYNESMQYSLWSSSLFAISKAIWAEICAFTTLKVMYHLKLVENELFDLLVVHVFCIPMTMVIIHPSLYWLLKLSLVFAIFLMFLAIRLLLGSFKQSKQLEMPGSKTHRKSPKIENSSTRNMPNKCVDPSAVPTIQRTRYSKDKDPNPRANAHIQNGASGDSLLNSFSTLTPQPSGNPLMNKSSRRRDYHPAASNSTPNEPASKSQEFRKTLFSKSTQAGASTTSMVESSTSTSTNYSAWNPLCIRNRQRTALLDNSLVQDSQMSASQVSVSTQASNNTSTSSAWKVLEYKTRNGKVYKAILCNEKAGISRPIDPEILYGSEGKSDYTGNN